MVPAQKQSPLARLRYGKAADATSALTELVEGGQADAEVVSAALAAIQRDIYLLTGDLARLVSKSGGEALYKVAKPRLLKDDWALVELHGSHYPDPEIEEVLCARLYKCAKDDGDPRRSLMVASLEHAGTLGTLATLEAICLDLGPGETSKRLVADAMPEDVLFRAEAISREVFVEKVRAAIDAVKARQSTGPISREHQQATNSDSFARANSHRREADLKCDADPASALNSVRKSVEAVIKEVFRAEGLQMDSGKLARAYKASQLLQALIKTDVLGDHARIAHNLLDLGNIGSHDEDPGHSPVSPKLARAAIAQLDVLMIWFDRYEKGRP